MKSVIQDTVVIRQLYSQDYVHCWQAMRQFTDQRDDTTPDELWLLEHPSVFTLGQNGKTEHILKPGEIPIIKTDRGGQVTYHGPGQLVIYTLVDIKRKKMNIRELVSSIEKSVIACLADYQIDAIAKPEAPGIYVNQAKICSLGLRVRRGCSYHGLAFNIEMDLEPFSRINPCGFSTLKMTQLIDFNNLLLNQRQTSFFTEVSLKLVSYLVKNLGYTSHRIA